MIPLGSLNKGSERASASAEQEMLAARTRAAKAAQLFPAKTGIADLVGAPAGLQEKTERSIRRAAETFTGSLAEYAARMERIPAEVRRRAAEQGAGTDLHLMEVVSHVYRSSLRAAHSGLAVPVIAVDVANALQLETSKVDALLDQAVDVGLLRRDARFLNGGTYRPLI